MDVLEIKFEGWTATPRMPFILSGNAICMHVPSYSIILGVIGCCLGRVVESKEVNVGYRYYYETNANDIETRTRLEFDGKRVKPHAKGSDAYEREFHINPQLTLWITRLDWENFFRSPVGTPSLGRSQDLLKIVSVEKVSVEPVEVGIISGCLLPYSPTLNISGQLVQLAESYTENSMGEGRIATCSKIFIAVPFGNDIQVSYKNLFQHTENNQKIQFYLHDWD